jgi:hypothetical protein
MKDLIFMRPDEVRQKRGALYLLESDSLFKIGSSAEPMTRVRAQKVLFHEDATTEAVQRVWIAPMIESYERMERVFQHHVAGYGLGGQESNRETWLKGCGWSRSPYDWRAELFAPVPDDCLTGYFRLFMLMAELLADAEKKVLARFWEDLLRVRKLTLADFPMPQLGTANREPRT